MLYGSELSQYTVEAMKNICEKSESAVVHCTVTRWLKKVYSGWKNLDDQSQVGLKPSIA